MRERKNIGERGETLACEYLERCGFTITARNMRLGHLEADIICEDERYIVFVEVKTRTGGGISGKYGSARDAVNEKKKARILLFAKEYIYKNKPQKRPRIDVIEVYLRADGVTLSEKGLRHIKNAVENNE